MSEISEQNFMLTIEYDGSAYHGWQRQKSETTIQATIEMALAKILGHPQTLNGSGRTDAGVHAQGQVANFKCHTRIAAEEMQRALNSLLPEDIVIHNCQNVDIDFHARFAVKSKTYHYHILDRPLPVAIGRHYVWHIRAPLDVPPMQAALSLLVGRHDFRAFEGTGSPRAHTVRNLFNADIVRTPEGYLRIVMQADGFLRYMVRNIVGTLVEVGRGKMHSAEVADILAGRERHRAGATAPAHGLCLIEVNYESVDKS